MARVYDYYLGGSTNWLVDREFADALLDRFPLMRQIALMHREFLTRVVRVLSRRGVRQFLDIGSGIPGHGSTHRIADYLAIKNGQAPKSRVIYVDNDPIAVGHAKLLLSEFGDPGRHVMLEADIRDPRALWRTVRKTGLFKRNEPIAVLFVGFLHLQQFDLNGNEISLDSARRLCKLVPNGSYVALSHVTNDSIGDHLSQSLDGLKDLYAETAGESGNGSVRWRSRRDIEAILDGFEMVHPGWTSAMDWIPEDRDPANPEPVVSLPNRQVIWAGVGRTQRRSLR